MISKLKKAGIVFCAVMSFQFLSAQDVHFSQYNYSPLELNPALAGLNNCDYRLAVIGRTQWNTISASGNTFSSMGASGDFSVGKVTKFNSFAGVGISLQSDIAGVTSYVKNRASFTFAYHFMLDRRGNSSLSVGLQFGVNHRGLYGNSTYDVQYNTTTPGYDASIPSGENFGRTNMLYLDAGVGALYSVNFKSNRNNIYIGIAANHLNQPNISWKSSGLFNDNGGDKLYIKTTIHGGGSFQVGDKAWIMPTFMLLFQGAAQQYNFGSLVKLRVGNNISTTFFYVGAQYRAPLDAVILQARLDYKGLSVGVSYDINVSKLVPASQTVGAPELGIMYQGCLNRKPRPMFCPPM
jgi:type IX secretion system PorP/SprF family membrane protein